MALGPLFAGAVAAYAAAYTLFSGATADDISGMQVLCLQIGGWAGMSASLFFLVLFFGEIIRRFDKGAG